MHGRNASQNRAPDFSKSHWSSRFFQVLFSETWKNLALCFLRQQVFFAIPLLRGFWGKGRAPSWMLKELGPWILAQFISDWGVKVNPWCLKCSHACDVPWCLTTPGLGTWTWRGFAAPVWHQHWVLEAWEASTFSSLRSFQIKVCQP